MRQNNYYLRLLFNNISNLLKKDLKVYILHPVEDEYFKDIINFFESIKNAVKSWSDEKNFSSSNLISVYAIPDLFHVYEKNKNYLTSILEDDDSNTEKLTDFIYNYLKEYYDKRELDPHTKEVLGYFFDILASQQNEDHQFEKLESLSSERYSNIVPA